MKFSILGMMLLAMIGCSKINEETINSALIGHSYYLMNKDSISVPVEFLENCTRHYDWTVNVDDEWSVKEVNGKPVLIFDTHEYEPKLVANDELEFFCSKTGESLKKASEASSFDVSQVDGNWVDALYEDLEVAKINKLPIPNCAGGSLKNPSFVFKPDNKCIVQDFCEVSEMPYFVNQTFKTICIGEPCKPAQIWKIREITASKLVMDRKYSKDGKDNFEYNKTLLKK